MLVAAGNPMNDVDSSTARASLESAAQAGHVVDRLVYGPGDTFVIYNGDDDLFSPDLTDAFEAVEHNLSGGATLWQRMEDYGVVGVSIAIVENNQVRASRGYGYRSEYYENPVLGSTPFDLASLSKYVGSLTTLAVLEDDVALYLGTDVLDVVVGGRAVETWQDRGETDPSSYGFPASLDPLPSDMTFRRLLSHTAGMRSEAQPGEPWLLAVETPIEDLMSGWVCDLGGCDWDSADDYAWADATVDPGDQWLYSGPGYMLAQATIEDHTGMTGAELIDGHLVGPLGLENTTGESVFDSAYMARMAQPHDPSGQQQLLAWPWTFAGGVHASAGDYAELVILATNEGRSSGGRQILWSSTIAKLLEANTLDDSSLVSYGLGVDFDSTSGVTEANGESFYHDGTHTGQTKTYMCGNPSEDGGIVILFNTEDAGGTPNITSLRNEILTAFVAAAGWGDNCS